MLIAQRGDTTQQPANTIAAFEAAHGLGACAIHTEVHFSANGTPWCLQSLGNTSPEQTCPRDISGLRDLELRKLPINSMEDVVDWASRHRHLEWFIEVGDDCLNRHGLQDVVEAYAGMTCRDCDAFALLSSDMRCLRMARSLGCHRVALKVGSIAECLSVNVLTLAPDYLFIDAANVDCEELPPGPWQWVVYTVSSTDEAVQWRRRGAHHLLTDNLPLLMRCREASDVYGF